MKAIDLLRKWKTHFLFGAGFLLAYSIYVVANIGSGRSFSASLLAALTDIKPFEYIMFGLLWYGFATGWQSKTRPAITTLGLNSSNT
jgi:hypothetical protein